MDQPATPSLKEGEFVVESFARPPQKEVPLIVKQQSMQIERLMEKIQMRKKKQPSTNRAMSSKHTGQ